MKSLLKRRRLLVVALAVVAGGAVAITMVLTAGPARADELATLHVLEGAVVVRAEAAGAFEPASEGQSLRAGSAVRTGSDGRAEVRYFDGSLTRLDVDTTFEITELASIPGVHGSKIIGMETTGGSTLSRIAGLTDPESRVEMATPSAIASVRGTIFFTAQRPDGTWAVGVLDGLVTLMGDGGTEVDVPAGFVVEIAADGTVGEARELAPGDLMGFDWLAFNLCELDPALADLEAVADLVTCPHVLGEAHEPEEEEEEEQEGRERQHQSDPVPMPPPSPSPSPADDPIETSTIIITRPHPPSTEIFGGPASGSLTNERNPRFRFRSADSTATFECRLDTSAWQGCISPASYANLGEGPHIFRVRATDAAGNTGGPAVRIWTIDATPPGVTIDRYPDALTRETFAFFAFSSEDDDVESFHCRLDGEEFGPCPPPAEIGAMGASGSAFYSGLGEGDHTFEVRALDHAGNMSASAAHDWTVDTTPPDAVIDGILVAENVVTIGFSSTHQDAASFECRLDAAETVGTWESCTPPWSDELPSGSYAFSVRATDAAGNTGDPDSAPFDVGVEPGDGGVNARAVSVGKTPDPQPTPTPKPSPEGGEEEPAEEAEPESEPQEPPPAKEEQAEASAVVIEEVAEDN